MGEMGTLRWVLLATSTVLACTSPSLPLASGAGGQGGAGGSGAAGGEGASAPIVTRPLTVKTVDWFWHTPLPSVELFAHRADGTLIGTGSTGVDGSGTIAVEDGGFVSATFLRPADDLGNRAYDQTVTIEVTPELTLASFELVAPVVQSGPFMPQVDVVLEQVPPDAIGFEAWSSCNIYPAFGSHSQLRFDELRTCPGSDKVSIYAVALGQGPGVDPVLLAHGWLLDQPFVSGQTASFAIPLTPPVIATPQFAFEMNPGEQPWFEGSSNLRGGLRVSMWTAPSLGEPNPYVADFPGLISTRTGVLGTCEAGQQTSRWLDVWSAPPIDVAWDSLALAAPQIADPQSDPIAWTLDHPEQQGVIVSHLGTYDDAKTTWWDWSVSQPAAASGARPRHFEWPPERAALLARLEDADAGVYAVAPNGEPRPYAEVVATQHDPGLMTGAARSDCSP